MYVANIFNMHGKHRFKVAICLVFSLKRTWSLSLHTSNLAEHKITILKLSTLRILAVSHFFFIWWQIYVFNILYAFSWNKKRSEWQNNNINSHAQDTTALKPMCFECNTLVTGHKHLTVWSPANATNATGKAVLVRRQQYTAQCYLGAVQPAQCVPVQSTSLRLSANKHCFRQCLEGTGYIPCTIKRR